MINFSINKTKLLKKELIKIESKISNRLYIYNSLMFLIKHFQLNEEQLFNTGIIKLNKNNIKNFYEENCKNRELNKCFSEYFDELSNNEDKLRKIIWNISFINNDTDIWTIVTNLSEIFLWKQLFEIKNKNEFQIKLN